MLLKSWFGFKEMNKANYSINLLMRKLSIAHYHQKRHLRINNY